MRISFQTKRFAKTFHEFFSNVVKCLNISQNPHLISGTSQTDPVLQSIEKFSKHPSIRNIKKRMNNSNYTFSFKSETQKKFSKLIQNLNCNKATQQYDIPIKILKEKSEVFSYILCHNLILPGLEVGLVGPRLTFVVYIPRTKNVEALRLNDFS